MAKYQVGSFIPRRCAAYPPQPWSRMNHVESNSQAPRCKAKEST